jgi:two-component sensor histidine kinase
LDIELLNKIIEHCEKKLDTELSSSQLNFYRKEYGGSLNDLSIAYSEVANYSEAIRIGYKTLKHQEKWGNTREVASALNNIGLAYAMQKDYEHAIDYYDKILALKTLISHTTKADALHNKAIALNNLGHHHDALPLFQESLKMYKSNTTAPNVVSIGNSLHNLGKTYLNLDKPDSAIYYLKKGLKFRLENEHYGGAAGSYNVLAQLNFDKKNYSTAISNARLGLKYSLKGMSLGKQKESHEILFKSYKKLKMYNKALSHYELFTSVKDSLHKMSSRELAFQEETKYEYEKKAITDSINVVKKTELVARDHQQKIEEQKSKTIFAYTFFGGSILIILLIWMAYRQKRASNRNLVKKNLLIEQALTNKELFLKEIHHRVKNNMQMVSSILQLKSSASDNLEIKKALNESQSRIYSMSIAHQKMYRDNNFESLDLSEYIKEIVSSLFTSSNDDGDNKINFEASKIMINVEQAQAVGFIAHELVSNSLKHAWSSNAKRELTIIIKQIGEEIHFLYSDNGKGLPSGFNLEEINSLGLKLVRSFTKRQLKGNINFSSKNGTISQLTFTPRA